jgi:hypothetical protein
LKRAGEAKGRNPYAEKPDLKTQRRFEEGTWPTNQLLSAKRHAASSLRNSTRRSVRATRVSFLHTESTLPSINKLLVISLYYDAMGELGWTNAISAHTAPNIVVLDGKNAAHQLFKKLKMQNLPAHIFVLDIENQQRLYVHNPMFKGNDYSELDNREGELKQIDRFHKSYGISIVIGVNHYATPALLLETMQKIKKIIPHAKTVLVGPIAPEFDLTPATGHVITGVPPLV